MPTLERCLRSVHAAGWDSPLVFAEPGAPIPPGIPVGQVRRRSRKLGPWRNWLQSLRDLLAEQPNADGYFLIQDDTLFCRGARDFLELTLWPDAAGVVSIYCPKSYAGVPGYNIVRRGWSLVGALAYLFPPDAARKFVNHPSVSTHRGDHNIDSVVGRWAMRAARNVYYLSPSLAQHLGDTSTIWVRATNAGVRRSSNFVGEDFDVRLLITETDGVAEQSGALALTPTERATQIGCPPISLCTDEACLSHERDAMPRRRFRIAFLTTFYNPCKYAIKLENYLRFRQRMEELGCEVFVAELSFDGTYEIPTDENVFRFDGESVLWHKERLLNCLLERLPAEYDAVAWIDAEILIYDDDFLDLLQRKLQTCNAVQLFKEATTLHPHGDEMPFTVTSIVTNNVAAPGYGWAYRRDVLVSGDGEPDGFFDAAILGNGDTYMALAALRLDASRWLDGMTPSFRESYRRWAEPFARRVDGKVGYLPIHIRHLWHGKHVDRRWNERQLALRAFEPGSDIRLSESGIYEWAATAKPDLVDTVQTYFHIRREDLPPCPIYPKMTPNEYFDHVYCVNLDRRTDRWVAVAKRFKERSIEVERWSAIEPATGNEHISKAILGCNLSHMALWLDSMRRGFRKILVFEDDVIFHRHFDRWFGKIAEREWTLLYLGASQYSWNGLKLENGFYRAKLTYGTFAYGLDCSIIPKLIQKVAPLTKVVDNCYTDEGLVCYPNLCIADVSESDLRAGRDRRKHSLSVRWVLEDYE